MKRFENLKPTETDMVLAYASLLEVHEPRTAFIGHTELHACVVCDEIWPCHVAVILAGFREFRAEARKLAEATLVLANMAKIAAEVISDIKIEQLNREETVDLLDRLTAAIDQIQQRKG